MERLKNKTYFYKNIFILGSLMWSGNVVEYFSKHTENLVVLYFLPRWDKKNNFVRIYKKGKINNEYTLFSPKNMFVQYFILLIQSFQVLIRHFKRNERFIIITYHPYLFFIQTPLRFFRKFDIVFWIVDYFPSSNLLLKIYQKCITYFHKKNKYNIYLSNRLNKVMNNKIINNNNKKTVMWGVKKALLRDKSVKEDIRIYYNGVVREEHGLPILFDLVRNEKNISLRILGSCEKLLFRKYKQIIYKYKIEKQIYFPNKFFTEKELFEEAKKCHIAVGLYAQNKNSYVYYADPGKIKLFAELGLPIIMTRSSEIAEYIQKFNAGELVERNDKSLANAIIKISKNYGRYIQGLKKFNDYFNYETYYKKQFAFLEFIK